ncbi:response regulator [Hyalangium rubrum]|uniref:Response regulator n=1 Tax=Hyalangium rubrum TaxID=3103134 RepID=A0ABU5H0B3_9BACT|nr:response regulator [Hyalangium sp. s54d21]MDY7226213.1 response regulator [Hyalangium sp. s54d21]
MGLQVLYVEDDIDIQDALREILESAGYRVTVASTATEGLALLGSQKFHLVISDYNLPDTSGAKMLSQAAATGLLNCESLILTGASRLDDVAGYRVIRKPVDVDKFLAKLNEILAPVRDEELARAKAHLEVAMERKAQGDSLKRIRFVLYVSEASTTSLRALRNLQTLLKDYEATQVDLQVVDLSKDRPTSFDEDRVTFTPTLVRRMPDPRVYLLGTLENIQTVVDLLNDAKVERKR